MPMPQHKAIAQMDWGTFAEKLQPAARGGKRSTTEDKALREYFGDEEYADLQRLAAHARLVRSRAPVLGNIVFLSGIMGSNLTSVEKNGDEDLIWINLFRLAAGQLERLELAPDGQHEEDRTFTVRPTALDKRTYARALLWLRARWNVQPFAYDWRRDIDESADALARFIREQFGSQPVHLVAHSMGGLVSRNFIRRHHDLWQSLGEGDGGRGGRLVMLGTPNFGSFAIPQALTGVEKMVHLLAAIDLNHNLIELLKILDTFVGSYQMLPAPSKIPAATQAALYRLESWGTFPISATHLQRAFQFHHDLENNGTIDPERMIYIAGCNQETLAGLTLISPGEFDYTVTYAGDGRVPHTLGLLKDVPTYYVDEAHGDLPKNEKVLAAVDELLERGQTAVLPDQPIATRAIAREGVRWRRPLREQQVAKALEDVAERACKHQAPPDEIRDAEEVIMRAAVGQAPRVKKLAQLTERKAVARAVKPVPLRFDLVRGDITHVQAPVVVVGHYKGVTPTGAEGAIDRAVNGWITRAVEHGMIGGDLGRLFFIPIIDNKKIAAKAAVLAGMGEAGRFSREDLRYLMTNITYGAAALGLKSFATVLIGSGEGNLSKERALRGMLDGLGDALHRLHEEERVQQVTLVEDDEETYRELNALLQKLKREQTVSPLALEIKQKTLPSHGRRPAAKRERSANLPLPASSGRRITIERKGDVFCFSALSETAVIPVREVEIQSFFATGTAARLMEAQTPDEQDQYGRLLYTYLFPEDFRQLFDEDQPVTLILDRSSAAFPWEMACFHSAGRPIFFGPGLQLTRQFRTMLASAPGIMPPLNRTLKILVIADPAPEPELHLLGARREGRKIIEVLERARKRQEALQLEVVSRIGPDECDPVEILALILNEEFDIVHFAGHGIFDEENPAHSGWVFSRDCILSAREIFRARRVPRLVLANACFSAVVREGEALTADEMNRHLAGLAEAFFERGIQNYIGAGWPVADDAAVKFAATFYERVLDSETLGQALSAARTAILDEGPTWGAYHHYGQVDATLVTQNKN
jgi:pimeloyl-ACP methyl ester carboxylesterase/O-acetyl-ADP-ribose deacetylase (regulator of RNase III)